MDLKLDAAAVQALIRDGLVAAGRGGLVVEEVRVNYARICLPFEDGMLRPGRVISGPTLFTAADSAMYALVLAHLGPALMAVTSDMNLRFLAKARPGDVIGEAIFLKLGRRLAVMEARLSSRAEPDRIVAHATGSYALPIASDHA
ncbi:PaaI family thioesterase [Solimonas marina]|uniref:PaaI family thioesterase n=1 Tax=Solimonas marina TaxID=2714601 RepID=A0A969W8L9_9GAMM|nr:PaaI family thioesterase [Solimonas marina]NKF21914.1 PaaI family thioesterase [Solimonas marina]